MFQQSVSARDQQDVEIDMLEHLPANLNLIDAKTDPFGFRFSLHCPHLGQRLLQGLS